MRLLEWLRVPWLVAVASAASILGATALYLSLLGVWGVKLPLGPTWASSVVVALVVGALAFMAGRRPQRERELAEELHRGLLEKEKHLQQILSSAPVLLLRTDATGNILLAQGAALSAEEVAPETWRGRNLFEFGSPQDEWVKYVRRALRGETVDALIHQDGRDWEIHYEPCLENGKPAGMLGVATDVTARHKQERAHAGLHEHADEVEHLRQLNEMKTNLLNTAAHELNTPMTPVRLQLHLLKSNSLGELTPKQQRSVRILDRAVDRLGLLVDDILDVARVQSGKMKVEIQPVRMRSLLEEILETFMETAKQVGVRFTLDAGDDVWAHADPSRISQVLINLASNAIKFTPKGGQVTVRCFEDDGGRVRTEFQDSGRGLTQEEIDRLFQPFSQVHDPREVTARGTGLGLYISRGILEHHDGEIGVTSEGLGKGSTFHFLLPAAPPQEEEVAVPVMETKPQVEVAPMPEEVNGASPLDERLRELI